MRQGTPIVALESTIISHGMPYPQNLETAQAVEGVVREAGAVPATVAILGGRAPRGADSPAAQPHCFQVSAQSVSFICIQTAALDSAQYNHAGLPAVGLQLNKTQCKPG